MNLARLYAIAAALGWRNLPRRLLQSLRARTGWLERRLPAGEPDPQQRRDWFVDDYQPEQARRRWHERSDRLPFGPSAASSFRLGLEAIVGDPRWRSSVDEEVEALLRGDMRFFGHRRHAVGWPPDFQLDPLHGIDWPTGMHWSRYHQFDPTRADLKCVWEASRFAFAYTLARAGLRRANATAGGDPAASLWEAIEAWDAQNPYGLTVQWANGQEAAFRMFAWLFAVCALVDRSCSTADRLHRLTELVALTARHVAGNLNYARGQHNNHALSEAIALWSVGLQFPELRRADSWRSTGKRVLEEELLAQVATDGSYVQHSVNYHRLMLDVTMWGARVGELHDDPLSPQVKERLEAALDWYLTMIDPDSGGAPNFGANDGAQVLPLSTCEFTDHRPTAQAASYWLRRRRAYPAGPWDETMLWLFGPEALAAPVQPLQRRSRHFDVGGYSILSGERSWGLIRSHSFRTRPSQADMLHLDLWDGGCNVLRDAGTYHYFTRPPWQDYFAGTAAHNTVCVDGLDQMERGPRFLWLYWLRSTLLHRAVAEGGDAECWVGEHDGYRRRCGVLHRRILLRLGDVWNVIDDVLDERADAGHTVALHWRLHPSRWERLQPEGDPSDPVAGWLGQPGDRPLELRVWAPAGFAADCFEGRAEESPVGWESRHYAERTAVPTVRVLGTARGSVRCCARFGPPGAGCRPAAAELRPGIVPVPRWIVPAGLVDLAAEVAGGYLQVEGEP